MWAELRFEYPGHWGLEIVGERDGQRVVFFGEGIEAAPGHERSVATRRLHKAGHALTSGWQPVPGGWDADVS